MWVQKLKFRCNYVIRTYKSIHVNLTLHLNTQNIKHYIKNINCIKKVLSSKDRHSALHFQSCLWDSLGYDNSVTNLGRYISAQLSPRHYQSYTRRVQTPGFCYFVLCVSHLLLLYFGINHSNTSHIWSLVISSN